MNTYMVLSLVIACFAREGLGAATFIDLPTGGVVANFEGVVNDPTLVCNVTDAQGDQSGTVWSLGDLGGVQRISSSDPRFTISGDPRPEAPSITFDNRITVLNWTSALDGTTLFCGTGDNLEQASVSLRIYRPPNLQDNFVVRLQEKSEVNVPVDLRQDPPAFPEPTEPNFTWMRNGQPLRSGLTTTYSNVTFDSVARSDAGNYTVTATNFLLNDSTIQVGSDSGSFYLDVLYPPSFTTEGPTERYVLLGDSLSLLCGTGLDSNPAATIIWTAPGSTNPIVENARYDLENGPEIVRLNFTHTIPSDTGVWVCEATAVSEKYIVSEGQLVRQDNAVIGRATVNIQLTVIIPPGQPTQLSVDSIGATWALICWTAPSGDSMISRYEILAREVNGSGLVNVTTGNNSTFFNVTGLFPATTYSLSVVALSEGGDIVARGSESEPEVDMTGVTVPALNCSVEESQMTGSIVVTWSFTHTGGLPLTALSTSYSFMRGLFEVNENVAIDDLDALTTSVPDLVVGFTYEFTVTATNGNGSSTASCGSLLHRVGTPVRPEFRNTRSGPGIGEVTLQVLTSASGVTNPVHGFAFVITPVLEGQMLNEITYDRPNYISGREETIVVSGLMGGRVYTFSATAMNTFGESEAANSPPVTAAGQVITPTSDTPPPGGDTGNSAAVVGGAVGGILIVVIIIAVLVVVVVALLLFRGRGGDYHPNKYEKAPTAESNVKVQEVAVDIGQDMENPGDQGTNEIQYAELDTFRPPSRQKNGTGNETKPIESEEPVEYATIASFKKVEDPPTKEADPAPTSPTPVTDDADKTGTSTTVV